MERKTLVVIPTYNERDNVAALCEGLLARPEGLHVLVVDDNSPDGTAAAAREVAARHPGRVDVLCRDFSHRPEEIPLFLEAAAEADVVVGSRYLPASRIVNWPRSRRFFSKWANRYARFFLGIPISDYTNGYRCYRRAAVEALDPGAVNATGYVVLSEVAYQLHLRGFGFADVPTEFVNRRRGESNLSVGEIVSAFAAILRLRLQRGRFERGVRP
jgi:dolichol-phosphate mannosyltransferase